MALNFRPKPGKPHIAIRKYVDDESGLACFYLAPMNRFFSGTWDYVSRVNPGYYSTPGEAARALHYGSKS